MTDSVHGSKRGLGVEYPMAGVELTCWAGTKRRRRDHDHVATCPKLRLPRQEL